MPLYDLWQIYIFSYLFYHLLSTKKMEKDTNWTVIVFIINGVNSLIGWNAVLAALDYFQQSFTDFNVYSFLPIPLFMGYLSIGFTYHQLSNKFKYVNMIIVGNSIVTLFMVTIFLVSILGDQTTFGFFLLLLSSFFIGFGANLSQITFFAMINYLSQDVVSKFTVGTAISGLFITVVRMIILAIAGADNKTIYPIMIYFLIAIAFNTADMFLNIRFCKSEVYKNKIDKFLLKHDAELQNQVTDKTQGSNSLVESLNDDPRQRQESVDTNYVKQQERIQGQHYFKTLFQTSKNIFPYPYIIMLTFVLTFTLFPGPSIVKSVQDMNAAWSTIIMLFFYNIGDTLGKYSAEFKNIFNVKSLNYIFFGRLIFIFTISVLDTSASEDNVLVQNYIFPFLNQFIFAFTNGFCINASFIMAFTVCPHVYKKYAGVLCGLTLQIGIMLGTVVQIPYSYIIGIN